MCQDDPQNETVDTPGTSEANPNASKAEPPVEYLTQEPPVRKSARLTSALLNYSRPIQLNLVPLGSSWSLDVFARINNAARRALIDLYNMVDGMQRRIHTLRSSDLSEFLRWWSLLESFLSSVTSAYETILYPWVSQAGPIPQSLSTEKLNELNTNLQNLFDTFKTIGQQLPRRAPDETVSSVIKGLVDIPPLVTFFADVEEALPDIVEGHYTEDKAEAIHTQLTSFLHKNGASKLRRFHLHLVARSMTEDVASVWRKSIPLWARLSFLTSATSFKEKFVSVVHNQAAA